jgi:hypothetical protein
MATSTILASRLSVKMRFTKIKRAKTTKPQRGAVVLALNTLPLN